MPFSPLKKTILAFLAVAFLTPALLLSAPKRADAILPVADAVSEKNFWVDLGFGILENALYTGLKGALKTLAEASSNAFMDFATGGYVGRQPAWDNRAWMQFGIDVLDQAAGGAAEGYFLTVDSMNRASEAGIKNLDKDAKRYDDLANESHKQADEWSDELDRDWQGFDCERYVSGGMTDEEANASRTEDGRSTKDACGDLRQQYDQQLEASNQADQLDDRASAVRKRIGQFNASEGDRFLKYQKNRAGALSPNATSILRRACNPNFGLEFNIGLGLGGVGTQLEPPVCKVSQLYQNWTGAIQGTGVAISDIMKQTGQNPWQTLADAVDPRRSNIGVALTIHQNIIAEQEQVQVSEMIKRWFAEQEGFKPVADVAGNIMTPAPFLKQVYTQQVKEESDVGKRLTGKAVVDAADLVYTFVSTLIGNTTKLYFDGLRKKANEVNAQLAEGGVEVGEGGEFVSPPVSSSVIYNPDAAPQNFAPQEVIARRSAQLAIVKTTSGDMLQVLSEMQIQDCNTFPNACTLGSATGRAIQDRLTVGEAMKKYRESGGNIGMNPLGVFGFTSRSTSDKPVQPIDYKINYPYDSMVVMRKYRILPVAWELAALYIRDHSQDQDGGPCDNRDCTLQDLVNNFDNKSSPFYRLVDPNWVLKLPQVRCELKGYGPAALKPGTTQEQDPVFRPEVCLDERTWLHEGTPQDWERAEKSISNDDYGYCVEEKKVFQISGTQCKRAFSSCDTFTELGRDGKNAKTQFFLKDSLPAITFADTPNTNVCKADNAGCSWLSTARRQYETCLLKVEIKEDAGNGNVKYVNKRQLLENKTLQVLWTDPSATTTNLEDTSWKTASYQAKAALCGTIREGHPDGSTFTTAQEWTASSTDRVFLSYKAEQCSAEFEGCRDLGDGNYLKIAPKYLKCDEPDAWQRGECQRYALHCTADAVGCQLYQPESRFESPVTATTPLVCVSGQCVGLENYLLQPSLFNPTASTAFYAFKASAVQSCNAQASGCEEFTNLAQERTGAEARTYFTNTISCEQKPTNERTVFYSYFGSEQGGRQPMPYSLKPNGTNTNVPDCVAGYTCTGTSTIAVAGNTVVCDDAILTQQYYNTSGPPACREFISANGTVSYRLVDKLVYQTDDCTQYRRSQDQQEYTYSTGMSRQCAPQYKGCRTYISTQAGNYKLVVRDAFDQSQGVAGWQLPEGTTDYTADTSLESENVGGRSMRLQKKSGTPTSYEAQKGVTIQNDYTYTFTLTARAATQNTLTATLKDLAGGIDQSLGTHTFTTSGWQYITFTATSSPTFSTATSTLSLVFSKGSASSLGSGVNNAVYVDNIYLKEASGKTVYAIDTSISSEEARPAVCRTAGSTTTADESDDIYQTGCQFYNDRTGRPYVDGNNNRVAYYGFQNVCPAAFVGCKNFTLSASVLTLVDDPKARCNSVNNNCTAYGFPKAIQEGIDTSGSTATTTEDIQSQYSTTSRKEQWQTLYFKITPEMIAASSTDPNAYQSGICKQEEVGCKAYDTAASKRYFKDPGKNVCQFFDTTPAGAKGQPVRPEGSSGGWFYKSCGKISDNLLNATYMNALDYPYISCRTDADCAGLNGKYPRSDGKVPIYTEKCDSYISCELEKDKYGNVTAANKPVGPAFNATTSPSINPLQDADAKAYWITSGPVSYAKQCSAKVSGCTEYEDTDCRPCGAGNEYCADSDPTGLKGTLITDYGRFNPRKGEPGTACRTKYYYVKSAENTGAQECRNQLDPENGCVLFRSTNQDAPDLKYNSKYYYEAYNNSKRAITINQADTNNGTSMYSSTSSPPQYGANVKDANVLLKAKLDRECSTPLVCSEEQASGGSAQCTQRLPCLITNEFGGCASIGFSARKACEGSNPLSGCGVDADCRGVVGTAAGARCVEVGVCSNDASKRCTGDSGCGGGTCLKQADAPYFVQLNNFCNRQTVEDTCNANIDCFWDPLPGGGCRAKDTASLVAAFDAPSIQTSAATTADLNLNFSMLSGYARPAMRFAAGQTLQAQSVLHRDSFFDWSVQVGSSVSIDDSDSSKLQNELHLGPYKVANSCRLYPSTNAPEQQMGKWNDACNYKSAGSEGDTWNIGLYGYCLEPYPKFATQFKQQWVGPGTDPKTLYRVNDQLATSTDAAIATIHGGYRVADGSYAYNSYRNSCLLWYPSDKLAAQTTSGAGASVGADIKAYEGTANNIYLCINKQDGGISPVFDTQAATTATHYIYEDVGFTGNHDKTYVQTRNSSGLKKSGSRLETIDNAGNSATSRNIVITTTEKSVGWIVFGGITSAATCGLSFVPLVGTSLIPACLGVSAGTILYATTNNSPDVKGFVELNSDEKLNGNGLIMDAISGIEYTIEGARRDEFEDFFTGQGKAGGNSIYSGSTSNFIALMWDKHSGDPANDNYRTYYNKSAGLASDVWKNGTTLYNWQDNVKGPVAFYFDENPANREGRRCRVSGPRGQSNDALCSGGTTWNAESFFGHGCGDGKNFVAIGPEIDTTTNRLKGWRWKYCDDSTSSDAETIAVSIKIKFKPYTSTHFYKGKNIYGDYCSELVRPTGTDSEAIAHYLKSRGQLGSQSGSFFTYEGKTYLIDTPDKQNTRLYFEPKIQTWEGDTWYTTPTGSAGTYLNKYPEALDYTKNFACGVVSGCDLSRAVRNSNDTITADTLSAVTAAPTTITTPGFVRAFPQLKDSITPINPDLRTTIFGKIYEKWREWGGSTYATSTVYNKNTRSYDVNTNNGHWIAESAADKSSLETMWSDARSGAQANRPTFYRATASSTADYYKRDAADTFTLIHNKRGIYQKVDIKFFIDATSNAQLPLRKLIVDWGDYVSNRSVIVDSNIEGTGKGDREGSSDYSNAPENQPFGLGHMYRDTPVGKTICIYAMDNWEAKSAVCGKIVKQANGDLAIPSFEVKRGADYTATDIDSTKWPPTVKGNCSFGSGAAHTGVDDNAISSGAIRCPF
ncbi:hypothetical protein HY622_03595 [Candidatus Uhrbacteria bacterium]|nr:hypothetical protein [Candidatus Uhrbacteria bacterium]